MDTDESSTVNAVFPHKFCINLDRRPDRWDRVRRRFRDTGIGPVTRFVAVDGEKVGAPDHWPGYAGSYGCLQSHLTIVRMARAQGWPSVLIFEDDVVFPRDFNSRFAECMRQLPPDWSMLFFGAFHLEEPAPVSENLVKLKRSNSTYAYALRSTVFDAFLEVNERSENPVDDNNFVLQQNFECLCFMPHLAWVEKDYSDTQHRPANHWFLEQSLVLRGADMDRTLARTTAIVLPPHDGRGAQSLRNVRFLAWFYREHLAGMRIMLVEPGEQSLFASGDLPCSTREISANTSAVNHRGRQIAAAMDALDPDCEYVVLTDGDTYLNPWDVRGNLKMCREFQFASGFRDVFMLNAADTRTLIEDSAWSIDLTSYRLQVEETLCRRWCFFRRSGLERLRASWEHRADVGLEELSREVDETLVRFDSPNQAFCLDR